MPVKRTTQEQFDHELAKRLRRMLRQHRPRYGDGPRLKDTIKIYRRVRWPYMIELDFTYDLIERMYQLRDGRPPDLRIPKAMYDKLYLQVIPFRRKAVPAIFVRLDPNYPPVGYHLRKPPKRWKFVCSFGGKKFGFKRGMESIIPDFFWWEEKRGIVIVLPDEYLETKVKKVDVYAMFGKDNE